MGLLLRTFFASDEADVKKASLDIVSQAAHDIRSPLSALNFSIHALKQKGLGEDGLELLNQAVSRINDIAGDILAHKRQELLNHRGIEMQEFVAQLTAASFRTSLQKDASITVKSTLNSSSVVVGNESQLTRLIQNLIENSCDAKASQVLIEVMDSQESIKISVKDNGQGIPQYIQKRVGQEGFTTKAHGNGLGLYAAKKNLEKWGGGLQIFSSPEGTQVEIALSKIQ